jgi:glyoxylase-like metal-dependent hydrolase (beta-lactamase superfamily II)
VNELLPGLWHWTAKHPRTGGEVSSHYVADSATVLDPMTPPSEGLAWFNGDRRVEAIVLTNRHHDRQSKEFCEACDVAVVMVPETGLYEYDDKDLDVRGYAIGEEVVPGIVSHEVGAICPDDMALEIRSAGALAFADGLVHYGGQVRFVSDNLMDDPPATKRGLVESLERLLDVDFDTLLFAHGPPIVGDGKIALREFLASNPAR